MTQIALVADPDVPVDELTMALWADALDQQSKEVCSVYGIDYVPVVFYKSGETLPIDGTVRVARIMMNLDTPGALGFHDLMLSGIPFSNNLWQGPDDTSVTVSHEDCEENADPDCQRYKDWSDKDEQAFELSDRVEGDTYKILATVGGVTREIPVSNWLLPSAFDRHGKFPFDKMGRLTEWNGMTSGGYVILRSRATGEVNDVFARRSRPRVVPASDAAHPAILRRLGRPDSRMMRRLHGGFDPSPAGKFSLHAIADSAAAAASQAASDEIGKAIKGLEAEIERLIAVRDGLATSRK